MFTKSYERNLERLGAFEVGKTMLGLAKNNDRRNTFLNAGRGNPNWINTQGRLAWCRIMEFGVEESRRTMDQGTLAGYTQLEGIARRFGEFLRADNEIDAFLKKALAYCETELKIDPDALVKELTDAVVGNNYPVPSRCLANIEKILNAFLQKALYGGADLKDQTVLFPTEGGTAAICYIFDSLKHNGLLKEGDRIAINTPIFTPYLQILRLSNFGLVEVNLKATEELNWHIPPEEVEKLRDPSVKAFFLVNPTNPGSHALRGETLAHIAEIVREREDLIIITDDVYGTFVDGFRTLYSMAPQNTILVYSFSKLFGVTGWRLGLIAMSKDNVCDKMLARLPEEKLRMLDEDYSIVTLEPRQFPFIERVCADSRSIGLYHTSGLSTPQQAMMAMMSLTHLVAQKEDPYFAAAKQLVSKRYHDLFSSLEIAEDNDPSNAKYYSLIDLFAIARKRYGEDFEKYMRTNFEDVDFLLHLAQEEGVVLMEGIGFASAPGTLRVSEANLPDEAYAKIAKRVLQLLNQYHDAYMKEAK